ncbi:MAG: helix-turn-helix transcriptional regulator [Ktedonobacteraceae bacterium]
MQVLQRSIDICDSEVQVTWSRSLAVEQVILSMHQHLQEPLSLEDMADIAHLSPYYFNRVFRRLIGIPPGEFFAALRLDEAKRLLLSTSLSVTDVCFELGYASLGSFTSRFTQLVGISPRHLRYCAINVAPPAFPVPDDSAVTVEALYRAPGLTGTITTPPTFIGRIYVGLFPKPIPQGMPVRCIALAASGPYSITDIPDGTYYVLVAALPMSQSQYPSSAPLLVGTGRESVQIYNGHGLATVDVTLRPPRLTDPPLILALPYV